MSSKMKGRFFFIEDGKEVDIKDLDYEYIRNSLMKEYKPDQSRRYLYTIVVNRSWDTLGNPIFDVRSLDLDKIYYGTTRLRLQQLMLDEILIEKSVKYVEGMPMPALQKEYKDWKEGRIPLKTAPSTVVMNIPTIEKAVRVPVKEDDERVGEIAVYILSETDKPANVNELVVLDWIDNYEVCNEELAIASNAISEKKIELATAIAANSDYLHAVFSRLRMTMEELFPLKPSFMKRLFGGNTDLIVQETDMSKVLSALQTAVQFDHQRFEGIKVMIENIQKDVDNILVNIENGKVACSYQVANIEDKFEWELGEQRLAKVGVTNEILLTSLMSERNKFMVDYNRLKEVKTVLIPLVVDKIQAQLGQKIDEETERVIRVLAYGADAKKDSE